MDLGRDSFMFLCKAVFMRTTVDLPEALFRKTKALAALRGSTMKDLIVQAIEKEIHGPPVAKQGKRMAFPLIRMPKGKKLNLEGFDFDDLLT
jgi:hypothetical protein